MAKSRTVFLRDTDLRGPLLINVFAVVGLGAVGSLLVFFLNSAGIRPYAVVRTRCERYPLCAEACRELDVEVVPRAPPLSSTH